tara:strand:- start:839 stop:1219 length:381 start_codon:yes stop_codon:yes gene_type:complete
MNFGLENTGRPFTDFNSNSIANQNLKRQNNISTNNEYRAYLTSNATNIMESNIYQSQRLTPFVENKHHYTPMPDKSNHVFSNDNDMKFPYECECSNLKEFHLSKRQLNQRKYTPMVNQDKLLSYGK